MRCLVPLFLNFRPGQSRFSHGKQGGSNGLVCLAADYGNPGNRCSCRYGRGDGVEAEPSFKRAADGIARDVVKPVREPRR